MELLIELGIVEAQKQKPSINANDLAAIRDSLKLFLTDSKNFSESKKNILAKTGSTSSIDRIIEILNVSETPIAKTTLKLDNETGRKRMRPWTCEEDTRLLAGILRFGHVNWARISTFVGGGRSRSQCAQRWTRTLDPTISKNNWTKEEDSLLIQVVHQTNGNEWRQVSKQLGNRSDVQCRYRYRQLVSQHYEATIPKTPIISSIPAELMKPTPEILKLPDFDTQNDLFSDKRVDFMVENDYFW